MSTQGSFKPSVILFDVNETLLDMTPLKKKVNGLLGSERGFRVWFGMMLQYSLVDNCTNQYHDFSAIGRATLEMAAKAFKETVTEKDIEEALSTMKALPAHTDVTESLNLLKKAGLRLAALSNSPAKSLAAQLDYAGLTDYFEHILSVDAVNKYKPAPEAYEYAARTLTVDTNEMVMVAAHGWDITGASHAGLHTCFIEREGQALYPLAPTPSISGNSLVAAAKQIIKKLDKT